MQVLYAAIASCSSWMKSLTSVLMSLSVPTVVTMVSLLSRTCRWPGTPGHALCSLVVFVALGRTRPPPRPVDCRRGLFPLAGPAQFRLPRNAQLLVGRRVPARLRVGPERRGGRIGIIRLVARLSAVDVLSQPVGGLGVVLSVRHARLLRRETPARRAAFPWQSRSGTLISRSCARLSSPSPIAGSTAPPETSSSIRGGRWSGR